MNPIRVSLTLVAAVANGYALSQSGTAGTALTLAGSLVTAGVGAADVARRVAVTSAGNDSGITFSVKGTNRYGNAMAEVLSGGNVAAVFTLNDFLTVTSITPSGNTAAAVTAGTNGVASTQWFGADWTSAPFIIALAVQISGTLTGGVEHTYDDINVMPVPYSTSVQPTSPSTPVVWKMPALSSITASAEGQYVSPVFAFRWTTASGTGTAILQALHPGKHTG